MSSAGPTHTSFEVRYTYQDYLSIPEHFSGRHEIVDGELFEIPTPTVQHQIVVGDVVLLLDDLVRKHGLGTVVMGPIAVRLHQEGVLEPDGIFIRADRLDIVNSEGVIDGPPDLVVEVLSPPNEDYDRELKRKHYMDHGVPRLWVVDLRDETVEVWKPELDEPEVVRDVLRWAVGPDGQVFEIPVEEFFRGMMRRR